MTFHLSSAVRLTVVLLLAGLVVSLAFLARIYAPAGGGLDVGGYQIGRDFINPWAAPQIAFSGHADTLHDLGGYWKAINTLFGQPIPFHNWSYPPFALLLYWPLGQAPYFTALGIWTVGLFGAYALVAGQFAEPRRRLPMALALAASPGCLINVASGQNGFLTAALFLGAILALDRRPVLAGVLIGLLTIKPQLGLVLPLALLALGAWRTLASAAATAMLLVVASVAMFGLDPWRHYLVETGAYQLGLLTVFRGPYTWMMSSVLSAARTVGLPFATAALVQALVSIPVLITAAVAVRWTRGPRQRGMILATATPLITPYTFNYDLTAVTVLIAWRLIDGDLMRRPGMTMVDFLIWLAPVLMMPFNILGAPVTPVLLIVLFVSAVTEVAPRPFRRDFRGILGGGVARFREPQRSEAQ